MYSRAGSSCDTIICNGGYVTGESCFTQAPARRQRSESSEGTSVPEAGLDGKALSALSYADTLPLRMCPGGMMSLIYASLVLAVLGEWGCICQVLEGA